MGTLNSARCANTAVRNIYLVAFRFLWEFKSLPDSALSHQGRPARHLAVNGSSGRVQALRIE